MLLSIIIPALNEEKNVDSVINDTLTSFEHYSINGEIVVINDGSTDKTERVIRQRIEVNPDKIRLVNHNRPLGIGASFWDGVEKAKGWAVCMLPGDNENIASEIIKYVKLLNDVDIIIPYVFNRFRRSKLRNLLSSLYRMIINTTFCLSLNYTNGTVIYKKTPLLQLKRRNKGFFYQTDILVRLIKRGYLFAEVPYKIRGRKEGVSKALSFKSLCDIVRGYLRLIKDIWCK